MIAQVDEQQVAMVPLAVHPAGDAHDLPDIPGAQGTTGVGAIFVH